MKLRTRKLLSLFLIIAVICSVLSISVFSSDAKVDELASTGAIETYNLKVGDTKYIFLNEADKAVQSAEYRDYLSRAGEDNELHYKVKLDAVKMLIENTENTFVTPVFNGSANLRNAAGQLIEEVCRASLSGKEVDGRYAESLFRNIRTLYRLEREVEGIPAGSVALIAGIACVNLSLLGFFVYKWIKKRKLQKIYLTDNRFQFPV